MTPVDDLHVSRGHVAGAGVESVPLGLERAQGGAEPRRSWLARRWLVTADLACLSVAFLLAEVLTSSENTLLGRLSPTAETFVFLATLPGWMLIARWQQLYDRDDERPGHSTVDEAPAVFNMVAIGAWAVYFTAWASGAAEPHLPKVLLFLGLALPLVLFGRIVARAGIRRRPAYLQRSIILGAGEAGQEMARRIPRHPEFGLELVGFVDAEPMPLAADVEHVPVLGEPRRLAELIRRHGVERVIVAFARESHDETLEAIATARALGAQVDVVPRFYDLLGPGIELDSCEGTSVLRLRPVRLSPANELLKRCVDLVLTSVALLLAVPLFVAIGVAIKLTSPGPVFYRHERVGRNGRPIAVLKFRTMHLWASRGEEFGGEEAETVFARLMENEELRREFEATQKLADDPRVTSIGKLLRRTSLDELPQLWNVLKGELSLVGPRAITLAELERYGSEVTRLLSVTPGVTGYWQINGRSQLPWDERVRLDLAYVNGWSLRLDLEIMAKTARELLVSRGAY